MSIVSITPQSGSFPKLESSSYEVLKDGYLIRDFDQLPVFCSFLPGVAGLDGVPLWAMYLNRGQGIVSFGMEGKDCAVMEFMPATMAWQLAPLYSFRTFVRVGGRFWEPFGSSGKQSSRRRMIIRRHSLQIIEQQEEIGLETSVTYATVPGSMCPALLRTVVFRNIGTSILNLEVLDGMPVIVPAGIDDFSMKKQRRITEAFCRASLSKEGVGIFAPPVSTKDTADVAFVKEASFYGAWRQTAGDSQPCTIVVDPDVVFGAGEDFVRPHRFESQRPFRSEKQNWENRLPCAFAHTQGSLQPGEDLRIDALAGYTKSHDLLSDLIEKATVDFDALHDAAMGVVEKIVSPAWTASAIRELDGYVQQNYLDNVLRGGIPVLFPSANGKQLTHVYTRRHGDLERDYNEFHLPAYPYSEGSGNFRDILQNRRNDIFYYPEIEEAELRYFFSLMQPDGYNPLAIDGCRWRAAKPDLIERLVPISADLEARHDLLRITARNFAPGEVMTWAAANIPFAEDREVFLRAVLEQCDAQVTYKPQQEGYWVDHWIYLLDLVIAFQGIYPDRIPNLLLEGPRFPWASCLYGLKRHGKRYELEALDQQVTLPPSVLIVRLTALAAIKALTLDREGRGIEMEAGRPGWNDAMNGLPGLRGSSMCETAALLRLCEWMLENWPIEDKSIQAPAILLNIYTQAENLCSSPEWDYHSAVAAREQFREKLYAGAGQELVEMSLADLRRMTAAIAKRTIQGIDAARTDSGLLLNTYFYRDVAASGEESVVALPLFLEGQVHLLRLQQTRNQAKDVYKAVRKSPLYDQQLAMYKLNESLLGCPYSIGRARTFSPGVYENESIWLHMSYKYLLEVLRSGAHEQFFADCKTMLVPFMNPTVYGRSILENSSFIGSSACAETLMQGHGYVARLSGSTAEFIHMWLYMTVGERPFRMQSGELALCFEPVLPAEWFRDEPSSLRLGDRVVNLPADCLATTFLGTILLVYHNPRQAATYGDNAARPVSISLDGVKYDASELRGENAELVRARKVSRIDVMLG